MSIGTNIKKRRYELRITQQELANTLGYKTKSTIAKIEADVINVSSKKLFLFAKALDTTVEQLLLGTDSPSVISSSHISKSENRNIVIILAGGKSTRNAQNIPNQFISVLGKPVIMYALEAYENHPLIDEIYIVCLKGWEDIVTSYANQYRISKLKAIVPSGETAILSAKNGVDYLRDFCKGDDLIIFQEATRPLVTEELISRLIQTAKEKGSAVIASPMNDHVQFLYDEYGSRYIDRNQIVSIQTPEAYFFNDLVSTFRSTDNSGYDYSETCVCMYMYNNRFRTVFVESSYNNMKIIRQEDVKILEAIIKNRN